MQGQLINITSLACLTESQNLTSDSYRWNIANTLICVRQCADKVYYLHIKKHKYLQKVAYFNIPTYLRIFKFYLYKNMK